MSHTETKPFVFVHTPKLRPAFEMDIFKPNGKLKKQLTIFIECYGCHKFHPLNFVLPIIKKSDALPVKMATRSVRQNCALELKRKLENGDLYVSENDIHFEINLNLN